MTERELKRLSRAELLELLLIQTRETEKLRGQLESAQKKLRDRHIAVTNSGDLAQAVLAVNGVMESANAAAQQYLLNIAAMEEETRKKCQEMLEQAKEEADQIRNGAKQEVHADKRVVLPVNRKADFSDRSDEEKSLDEHILEAMQMLGER